MNCSTNARTAPWPSSQPPASRITSLNSIRRWPTDRPCTPSHANTGFTFHRLHLLFFSCMYFPSLTGAPFSFYHRLIFKCVMCDTVFTSKNLLHVHFDSHLVNQKVHVYKCPECTKLFSQRNSLLDHYKVSAGLFGVLKASFMYL